MNYLIGQRFEHYQVEAFLGEGGMGSVYRARDLKHDRLVALKVMHAQLSQQAQFQQRFAQEAQAAANFNTPSIVKIHQHGTHEGIPFIVMEYISGGSLVSYLKQLRYSGNHLGLEEVIAMAAQVADGLGYAHQRGVIHRDIKPDNILLKLQREQPGIAGGAPRQAVITDFGLAILLKKGEDVATNPFMGSLPYMSPEQCLNQPLDGRSDIYSLGIMLYQLTTGQLPFKINAPADIIKHVEDPPLPPRLVNPDLPEAVETVILKTLAKKPGDRHQTGAELAHTLRQTALTAATSTASRSAMDHVVTQWVEQRWVAGVDVNNRVDVNQTWISEGDFRLFIAHQWEESRVEGMVKESFIIGRNPDNDIVLQDRGVSGQHAMIQRGETGWEVRDLGSTNGTFLGAKPLEYDKPIGWNSDETLHIGPYSLKWQLFKGGQRRPVSTVIPIAVTRDANGQTGGPGAPASALAAAAPVAAASLAPTGALVDAAPALDARSVSFTSDVLAVTITPQEMEVQPGVESFLQISVANYGLTVEDVSIRAETGGFFPSWMGFDRSEIKLMPDESQTVTLTLTPPQDSSLLAGEHHYAVIAATARSESVKAEGRIQVAKWEDFQLDMHPTNLQENVVGRVTINDRSNFDNIYNIAGLDDSDALIFAYEEPPQAIRTDIETQQQWLRMDAGAEGNASFTIEPKRRAWFGRDQLHSYEMRVRTETSEWQSLYGQVEIRPRISRRVMLFFILLLLLLGIGGYYGYREIQKRNQAELAAVTEELGNARATAEARAAEAESNSAAAVATREAADAALADAIASGSSASEIATREAEALAAGEAEAIAAATATAAAAEAAAADAAAADAAAAEATSAASSPAAVATPTPANAPPTNIVLSVTTIDEDSPIGTVVGVFTTIDPDGAALPSERDPLLASHDKSPIRFKILLQSGSYTYSLVAGSGDNDNSAFTISGDQLLTAKLLDFETQGRYNIRVQTDDGNNGIFEQPIVITVVDKNDPPTFTSQPIVTGRQDVPYSYSILINDPDASDTPVVTASTLPSWLTLTDNGDGTATLAGTPTNDEVGNHDVTLEVTDSGGEKDSQTFVLEIVNINDPPRFSSSPPTDATQDTLYSYNVITTVDPDANDTLTISSAPLPLPAWLTLTDNGDGTAELAGTPANADVGNHNVTLQVADAATATDTQTFTIIVANVNDAPVFTSTPVTDATQDIPYNYTVTPCLTGSISSTIMTAPLR
jgi:serine/threonine protein kinase